MSTYCYYGNISVNPLTHFGVWTPDGWRTHAIRFEETSPMRGLFSGDGVSTAFGPLPSGVIECVHDVRDSFCDNGIYPSEPRVEHPVGRPRWAVSHTFLCYPHADATLYAQECTWDLTKGELNTHFRQHVAVEEAWTDGLDGMTVKVDRTPISTVVVGNRQYPLCNSAVRGVWSDAEKSGENYYTQSHVRIVRPHNAVYILVDQSPVVQTYGIWKLYPGDERAFGSDGRCENPDFLIGRGVPLDQPKLGSIGHSFVRVPSEFYGKDVDLLVPASVTMHRDWLKNLQACKDVAFQEHSAGYAAWGRWDHAEHVFGMPGHYAVHFDFDGNGVVDEADEEILRASIGREVRPNYYSAAYFGNDWLSTGILLEAEMDRTDPVICHWSQGAGYDPDSGVIRLFKTPGPGKRVFVEYHYDAPAARGIDNIVVHYRTHRT